MKSSVVKYIVVGILILTIASCSKTQNPDQTASSIMNDPMLLAEKNAPTVEESVNKPGEKIKEEPSYRACVARSVQMCGSEVISRFSREKDSDEACYAFEDVSLKESCIDAVNTELARKKLDISYCKKLSAASKASCEQQSITAKAVQNHDIQLCTQLKSPIVGGSSNGTIMASGPNDADSRCIMQVVMSLEATEKNLEACKNITDIATKQDCVSMMQSRIEMQKNTLPTPVVTTPKTLLKHR